MVLQLFNLYVSREVFEPKRESCLEFTFIKGVDNPEKKKLKNF
jgi:hypothetical protein